MQLISAMNTSKWEALRLAMYRLDSLSPRWRTYHTSNGLYGQWDGEWFYHFREGGYKNIEWVEIEITSRQQDQAVYKALKRIHLPGVKLEDRYRIYGLVPIGQTLDYL